MRGGHSALSYGQTVGFRSHWAAIDRVPVVVVVEEHVPAGGLGSAVGGLIAETTWNGRKRFRRIGIPDAFPDAYGSQAELLQWYGITKENIAATVKALAETH